MNIKKTLVIVLTLAFIGVGLFVFLKNTKTEEQPIVEFDEVFEQDDANENNSLLELEEKQEKIEETREPMENEIYISFDPDTTNVERKEILESFPLKILDSDTKNNSYLVMFTEVYDEEDLKEAIEKIKANENVTFAFKNNEAVDSGEAPQENVSLVELSYENFNKALMIYDDNANTFIKPNENFTFLYPITWNVTDDYSIESLYDTGEITFKELDYQGEINDLVSNVTEEKYIIDGDIDTFTREDGAEISKWTVTDGETLKPQAIIKQHNEVIYFDSNEQTNFGEFALVVDSFTLHR